MKTALVTGGNRGLGLETCRQLAQLGFRVVLSSRGDEGARAAQALAAEGLEVEHTRLDVSDSGSIASLAEALRKAETRLDVLVNNAGVSHSGFNALVVERTLAVNFFGPLHVTEALLPHLVDGGHIVLVSSGMGSVSCLDPKLQSRFLAADLTRGELISLMNSFSHDVQEGRHSQMGWPSSAYSVSKVGLNALTRVLARELAPRKISVNAVCPGWARTDMGGSGAPRSVQKGAASIVWAAAQDNGPTGGFFRDGRAVSW